MYLIIWFIIIPQLWTMDLNRGNKKSWLFTSVENELWMKPSCSKTRLSSRLCRLVSLASAVIKPSIVSIKNIPLEYVPIIMGCSIIISYWYILILYLGWCSHSNILKPKPSFCSISHCEMSLCKGTPGNLNRKPQDFHAMSSLISSFHASFGGGTAAFIGFWWKRHVHCDVHGDVPAVCKARELNVQVHIGVKKNLTRIDQRSSIHFKTVLFDHGMFSMRKTSWKMNTTCVFQQDC